MENDIVQQSLDLLGRKVTDKVTGFHGVVVTIFFDLTGCIQAGVAPSVLEDGKIGNTQGFDVNRLSVDMSVPRVLELPDYHHISLDAPTPATYPKGPIDKSSLL